MLLSVIVPAYNEEDVISEFHKRISAVLGLMGLAYEVIFVNDGSTDETLRTLMALADADESIAILDLSRNFGKEVAMTAGLDHSSGDAVIIIDADLQDPPEIIPELVEAWKDGNDVVYARRASRGGESMTKKFTAGMFYRILGNLSKVTIPRDTGDFRLMSRRAVDSLGVMRERNRFMKGMFAWIGFQQKAVFYHRDPRHSGHTKWNYWRLWNLALEGITSFTDAPLKIATYFGLFSAICAFTYGFWVIAKTLLYGEQVTGFPTLAVLILFFGGVQLIAIGIIGEYLGRTYNESKQRPLYFINSYRPSMSSRVDRQDIHRPV